MLRNKSISSALSTSIKSHNPWNRKKLIDPRSESVFKVLSNRSFTPRTSSDNFPPNSNVMQDVFPTVVLAKLDNCLSGLAHSAFIMVKNIPYAYAQSNTNFDTTRLFLPFYSTLLSTLISL